MKITRELTSIVNAPQFLALTSDLQARYEWAPQAWKRIESETDRLRMRLDDENLHLGVVGEFSSGKSTLINAILRCNLLKEDILQGTTCAPTFLRYGPCLSVTVKLLNGNLLQFPQTNEWSSTQHGALSPSDFLEDMIVQARESIHQYTAQEDHAQHVERVTITLPSPTLKQGLVIVDTPGINAENPRHSEVAERTLNCCCDAAIVLTPATTPCSQTLCEFIREHLGEMQSHSIALITKVDTLKEIDRTRQIAYTKQRLETETGRTFAAVYAVAAIYTTEDEDISGENREAEAFKRAFGEVENGIWTLLRQSHKLIIKEKIARIIRKDLAPLLTQYITTTRNELQTTHDSLAANALSEPTQYFEHHAELNTDALKKHMWKQHDINQLIDQAKRNLTDDIERRIKSTSSCAELSTAIESGIKEAIMSQEKLLTRKIEKYDELLGDKGRDIIANFTSDFVCAYKQLSPQCEAPAALLETTVAVATRSGVSQRGINTIKQNIQSTDTTNKIKSGVGMGVGAVVGSLILPVWGTIFGGWLGSKAAGFMKKPINVLQQEALVTGQTIMSDWSSAVRSTTSDMLSRIESTRENDIKAGIRKLDKFIPQIRTHIAAAEQAQRDLKTRIETAWADLDTLTAIANS